MAPPSYTTTGDGLGEARAVGIESTRGARAVEVDITPMLVEAHAIENGQKQEGERRDGKKPGSLEQMCVRHKGVIIVVVPLLFIGVCVFLVQGSLTNSAKTNTNVTTTAVAATPVATGAVADDTGVTVTEAVTEAVTTTTQSVTTTEVTTVEATTTEVTTLEATTLEAATTLEVTTLEATTIEVTTLEATTEAATEAVPTQEATTTEASATTEAVAITEVCVPGQIMTHEKQLDYCGTKSKAEDDKDCWMWDKTEFWDEYPLSQKMLIKQDGQAHNYCRNPSNDDKAWCVTGPQRGFWEKHAWEFCDITASKVV